MLVHKDVLVPAFLAFSVSRTESSGCIIRVHLHLYGHHTRSSTYLLPLRIVLRYTRFLVYDTWYQVPDTAAVYIRATAVEQYIHQERNQRTNGGRPKHSP